jgi:outer membrane receptor protein involved in Fe transport
LSACRGEVLEGFVGALAAYIQDTVTHDRLTLQLGVRYDPTTIRRSRPT